MSGYFYREVERELRASAVPYRIETGTKHHKVFIDGKMVLTFSRGASKDKDTLLLKRAIKKYLAQQVEEKDATWLPSSGAINAIKSRPSAGNAHPS